MHFKMICALNSTQIITKIQKKLKFNLTEPMKILQFYNILQYLIISRYIKLLCLQFFSGYL